MLTNAIVVQQNNSYPDRLSVFDFCFEKKGNGQWIEWMDTIDRSLLNIPSSAKVNPLKKLVI